MDALKPEDLQAIADLVFEEHGDEVFLAHKHFVLISETIRGLGYSEKEIGLIRPAISTIIRNKNVRRRAS